MYTCVCLCVCVFFVCVCVCVCLCVRMCVFVCVCVRAHVHVSICLCVHRVRCHIVTALRSRTIDLNLYIIIHLYIAILLVPSAIDCLGLLRLFSHAFINSLIEFIDYRRDWEYRLFYTTEFDIKGLLFGLHYSNSNGITQPFNVK